MTIAKLGRAAVPDQSGTEASAPNGRRWGNGHSDPIARLIAQRLGMRPMAVEKLMRQVNHRCAAIIDGFVALEDDVRLLHFMAPIDAALAKARRPAFTLELVRAESETDQAEQIAEDLLLMAPTREAAQLWIRRSEAARAAALRMERAVAAKWEIGQ